MTSRDNAHTRASADRPIDRSTSPALRLLVLCAFGALTARLLHKVRIDEGEDDPGRFTKASPLGRIRALLILSNVPLRHSDSIALVDFVNTGRATGMGMTSMPSVN